MSTNTFQSTFDSGKKTQKQLEHIKITILTDKLYSVKPETRFETFLLVYLKLSYYICYSPFKVVNDVSGSFTTKFNIVQRILCIFLNSTGFIVRLAEFRQLIFQLTHDSLLKNPAAYFRIISSIVSISFQISGFYRLCNHSQDYVEILNFSVRHQNNIPKGNKIIQSRAFTISVFITFFCFAIYQVVYIYVIRPFPFSKSQLWTKELDIFQRYIFAIANGTLNKSISPAGNITCWDYVSAIFVVIGKCNR